MERSISKANDGGKVPFFSGRDLYYVNRNLYLTHPQRPFHREYMLKRNDKESDEQYEARRDAARRTRFPMDYKYFTQHILKEYEQEEGEIEGRITDARGWLHEPHTGETLALGTREVDDYELPEHCFDKLLVVEKETEWPKFEVKKTAERFDMAILISKGYAVEAVKKLLKKAEQGDLQIFVWHDADLDGYNIVRCLEEETRFSRGRAVEVIDLGLTIEDALRLQDDPRLRAVPGDDIRPEPFQSEKERSRKLRPRLTETDLYYFDELQQRFEINAIPAGWRIEYVEEQLIAHGVRPKYVPPDDELPDLVEASLVRAVERRVGSIVADIVDIDAIVEMVMEDMGDELRIEEPEALIRKRFENKPSLAWDTVIADALRHNVYHAGTEMLEKVREAVVTVVTADD